MKSGSRMISSSFSDLMIEKTTSKKPILNEEEKKQYTQIKHKVSQKLVTYTSNNEHLEYIVSRKRKEEHEREEMRKQLKLTKTQKKIRQLEETSDTIKSKQQKNPIILGPEIAEYYDEYKAKHQQRVKKDQMAQSIKQQKTQIQFSQANIERKTKKGTEIIEKMNLENKQRQVNNVMDLNNKVKEIYSIQLKDKQLLAAKNYISEKKQKAYDNLNNYLKDSVKTEIIEGSKKQIELISDKTQVVIERFKNSNKQLYEQNGDYQSQIFEMQHIIGQLKLQNQLLEKSLSAAIQEKSKLQNDLDRFKSSNVGVEYFYQLYPNIKLKDFIHKHQIMENKQISDVKICNQQLDTICSLEVQLKQKEQRIQKLENIQLNKQNVDKSKVSEHIIDEKENVYKQKYLELFNKIASFYNETAKDLNVYRAKENKEDKFPYAKLDQPEQILDHLQQNIVISTNQNLQNYLRRIVVNCNLLQRKYFPKYVNEGYYPEKVYERIDSYIQNIEMKNKKLQAELQTVKNNSGGSIDQINIKSVGDFTRTQHSAKMTY